MQIIRILRESETGETVADGLVLIVQRYLMSKGRGGEEAFAGANHLGNVAEISNGKLQESLASTQDLDH